LRTQQGVPPSSKSVSESSALLIGITCNPEGSGAGDLLTTAVELVDSNGGVKSGVFHETLAFENSSASVIPGLRLLDILLVCLLTGFDFLLFCSP